MDSFPAHAIIPSEVKDDTRIRGGGHSAMRIRKGFGSKMDRYIPCGARCSQLPKVL